MGEGDLKELRELVEFLKANAVAEFDMERPELKVRLKFAGVESSAAAVAGAAALDLAALARLIGNGGNTPATGVLAPVAESAAHPVASASVGAEAAEGSSAQTSDEDAGLHIVKSPLVGTFYDAPSPGAEAFVKVGDTVGSGDVVCIVEAMKIMNEIESDAAGQVVKVYVKPGQPVEYGQRLFGIRV